MRPAEACRYAPPVTASDPDGSDAGAPPAAADAALRDATSTAERITADEREADALRERLRTTGPTLLEPDGALGHHLLPGEVVHALRQSAILRGPGSDDGQGFGGMLVLTSIRVAHFGQVTMSIQLGNIVESAVAGERLLLSLGDGEGVVIDCARPRTFRAELADAIRRGRP